ncbi:pumilio homolog 12-like [Rutidosis leptorrhynchoides]|uniref:pumilio homolog 12-like n=1 Tax=Rutidosis leptorrhynchoides TaxID=125765 RepID=UPI003A99E63A
MEHRRNAHYFGTGVPFPPYLPPFVPDGEYFPARFSNLSSPIDVDRNLSNMFSCMNLSPATYAAAPPLLRSTLADQLGRNVAADNGGACVDGLVYSVNDFPVNIPFNQHRFRDDRDVLRRECSDYLFDFDQESNLLSEKYVYSTQMAADNKLKFQNVDFFNEGLGVWSLKELRGRICSLAKDQNGCRILQSLFERATIEDVEIVLSEVINFISDLMKDQFGNYLVQKLVAVCNDNQKTRILFSLINVPGNIIIVCMNPHGTRAMQKLLASLKQPNQVMLVMKALQRGAATLANDPNGYHVILYCVANFHGDFVKPIVNEIAKECYKVATDRSGCCVMQACVEHSSGELRTRIVTEIIVNSLHLAEDPYGNYVLQHLVGLKIPELTALLVRQLQGNLAYLSCNKYGSNVVEKCLNECENQELSSRIILELIRSPNPSLLLVDPYANFVIQSALRVSKGFANDCLRKLISKNVSSMRTNHYGKKILDRFEKKRVLAASS